jgi:hypothetical protein
MWLVESCIESLPKVGDAEKSFTDGDIEVEGIQVKNDENAEGSEAHDGRECTDGDGKGARSGAGVKYDGVGADEGTLVFGEQFAKR